MLSQTINNFFWKTIWFSWSKLSEKLKHSINILIGLVVLELLIVTCKILFWSITQEPLGLLKYQCYFWVSPNGFGMLTLFIKKIENFEIAHKTCLILIWGAVPLNAVGIPYGRTSTTINHELSAYFWLGKVHAMIYFINIYHNMHVTCNKYIILKGKQHRLFWKRKKKKACINGN